MTDFFLTGGTGRLESSLTRVRKAVAGQVVGRAWEPPFEQVKLGTPVRQPRMAIGQEVRCGVLKGSWARDVRALGRADGNSSSRA